MYKRPYCAWYTDAGTCHKNRRLRIFLFDL
nr:MAG TPA: hypothetical protein [Caudoviricetes sp.]